MIILHFHFDLQEVEQYVHEHQSHLTNSQIFHLYLSSRHNLQSVLNVLQLFPQCTDSAAASNSKNIY